MQNTLNNKNILEDAPNKAIIGQMDISSTEFELLRSVIYDHFGINLSDKKRGFIVSRLQKLLRTEGFSSFHDYYQNIMTDQTETALTQLANYISTNYTFFNRENAHFDFFLKTALPALVKSLRERGENDIRVWSAGCSSGEEPYMLAMLMHEYFGDEYFMWSAGVLATDISEKALRVAMTGVYSEDQIALVPENLKRKYFQRAGKEHWSIIPLVKKEVTFRRFNLMNREFPFRKPFHIIFCRNVMIYFDRVTRDSLVDRFFKFTANGGFFFIGHSESLTRGECPYEYIMPALYRKVCR